MSKEAKNPKRLLIPLIAGVVILIAMIAVILLGNPSKPAAGNVIEAGCTVTFGRYEQDGDTANGAETIAWQVLDVQDGFALLLSRQVLDAAPYHAYYAEVTWGTSDLRAWLNDAFPAAAFTEAERSLIAVTAVDNSRKQCLTGDAAGGRTTLDRVFLLSAAEVLRLLPDETQRLCTATAHAKAQGVYTSKKTQIDGQNTAWWWLRTPGAYAELARCADTDGKVIYSEVNDAAGGVRPALWVAVEALK